MCNKSMIAAPIVMEDDSPPRRVGTGASDRDSRRGGVASSADCHLVKPIRFHPEADAEVTEAVEFYEARSSGLGSAILDEIQRSLGQIAMAPEASQKIGRRVRTL